MQLWGLGKHFHTINYCRVVPGKWGCSACFAALNMSLVKISFFMFMGLSLLAMVRRFT